LKVVWELYRRLKALLSAGTQLVRLEQALADKLSRLEILLAIEQLECALAKPALADPRRLEGYGLHALSQFDADGILREIFRRIGEEHRTFVEFGTGDGQENNTAYLLCQGWRGLWIEGDQALHEAQLRNFAWALRGGTLACAQSFLTRENINDVVRGAGFAGAIDLLSVDVDGNDYHLWEALTCVEPRVVVVEYNAYAPPPLRWIMAYNAEHRWDGRSTYFGASLASLEALGRRKGLRLVGCDVVGLNAFLVREDLCGDRFVEGNAQTFWHPRRWWLDRAFPTGNTVPFARPFEER
jgi:hypothetical protein